jgi:putative ABC transport system substrate-binding protein
MGILFTGAASQRSDLETVMMESLRERGFVEGRNLTITRRYADGERSKLAGYAREIAATNPDVIVTMCTPSTRAMVDQTATIPIVMAMISDPVGQRFVTSLARPGGNVTGTASLFDEILPKMLETFAGVLPPKAQVAVLHNAANSAHPRLWKIAQDAARGLKLRLKRYDVENPAGIAPALESIARDRQAGLFVLPDDPMLSGQRAAISDFSVRHRIAVLASTKEWAESGATMAYGESWADGYRQAGLYADRILRGAKPESLPVSQPTKIELTVNAKTARAIGVSVPAQLLMRADKVIE